MTKLVRNPRVFIIAVLCGVMISLSYYVIRPFENSSESAIPSLGPLALLSLLTLAPRLFVARIIWEALEMPAWLGEVIVFLYWPFLGALLGVCKHWVRWGAVILVVNIALVVWVFYELSRIRITF
jgi:hypothetical protein